MHQNDFICKLNVLSLRSVKPASLYLTPIVCVRKVIGCVKAGLGMHLKIHIQKQTWGLCLTIRVFKQLLVFNRNHLGLSVRETVPSRLLLVVLGIGPATFWVLLLWIKMQGAKCSQVCHAQCVLRKLQFYHCKAHPESTINHIFFNLKGY